MQKDGEPPTAPLLEEHGVTPFLKKNNRMLLFQVHTHTKKKKIIELDMPSFCFEP